MRVIVTEPRRACLRRWLEAGTGLSERPAPDDVAKQVPAEDGRGCGPGWMFQELKSHLARGWWAVGRVAMGKKTVSYEPNVDTFEKKSGCY